LSFLFLIIMSGLFAKTTLSVCIPWFHKTVTSSCSVTGLLLLLLLLLLCAVTKLYHCFQTQSTGMNSLRLQLLFGRIFTIMQDAMFKVISYLTNTAEPDRRKSVKASAVWRPEENTFGKHVVPFVLESRDSRRKEWWAKDPRQISLCIKRCKLLEPPLCASVLLRSPSSVLL
jgi:hypothetical protein